MLSLTFVTDWIGGNARNTALPFGVAIIALRPGLPERAAIWAQERYEAEGKSTPWGLVRYLADADVRRQSEIMGHEIEVQVAVWLYGADEGPKRRAEAAALTRYDDFRGWDAEKIAEAMRKSRPAAMRWVDDHKAEIRKQL